MRDGKRTTMYAFSEEHETSAAALSVMSLMSLLHRTEMAGRPRPDRLRMHPDTWPRLVLSKLGGYATGNDAGRSIAGQPVELDPAVPLGIVRAEYDLAPNPE